MVVLLLTNSFLEKYECQTELMMILELYNQRKDRKPFTLMLLCVKGTEVYYRNKIKQIVFARNANFKTADTISIFSIKIDTRTDNYSNLANYLGDLVQYPLLWFDVYSLALEPTPLFLFSLSLSLFNLFTDI